MTKQKEIKLTPRQLNELDHDTIDLLGKHGTFSGSDLEKGDDGDYFIELMASSLDDEYLEVVATVYVRGQRLKELQEGGD